MSKDSKRFKKAVDFFGSDVRPLDEALALLKRYGEEAMAKFDETVEVVFKLSIDPKKTEQQVRGTAPMPSGLGKKLRVAVFTKQENFDEAKRAGASVVGDEELISQVKDGKLDFDVCVATPDMMPKLAVVGKVLGPKGMMPNPKLGTVTGNITETVQRILAGQVEYKSDAGGLVHAAIGKVGFSASALRKNFEALYEALVAAKPAAQKGVYVQKVYLSTSQGPSVEIATPVL